MITEKQIKDILTYNQSTWDEKIKTIIDKVNENGIISVKDRLPNEGAKVLMYCGTHGSVCISGYYHDKEFVMFKPIKYMENTKVADVRYWQNYPNLD